MMEDDFDRRSMITTMARHATTRMQDSWHGPGLMHDSSDVISQGPRRGAHWLLVKHVWPRHPGPRPLHESWGGCWPVEREK